MCNSIFLSDDTIPKAKDGEEVELTVKGIYHTDENGMRTLDVTEVDGNDVSDPDESDKYHQNSDDALRLFIIKTKTRK